MKKLLLLLITGALLISCSEEKYEYPFRNPNLSVEERIENLISLLEPEEKIGLMMNASKPVPRLGIPAYDWWNEALHGVARAGRATVFPQAIGMAATWNEEEHYNTFDIISDEARAKYNESIRNNNRGRYHGLSFWTPNINIFRDPRWGRGQETYGEDPFLTSRLGVAAVKGLQGNHPKYFKAHACAKHYAVHSGPEWNRHSYDAKVSQRDLWETYLPAFKALVQEGNVQEVMCAYNALDGQPCCANTQLSNILRKQWGFKGIVVTDCWAMNDFFTKGAHETHPNAASASADAIRNSSDLECGSAYESLIDALKDGLISTEQIDISLRRILRGWFELGMFDPEEIVPWSSMPLSVIDSEKHNDQALKIARQSITLLKNNNNILPLSKSIKKIAVIGPNAADSIMLWGNYNGFPSSTVTILNGIKAKLPNAEVIYDKGCELVDPYVRTSLYDNFVSEPNGSKGMKVEFYNNSEFKGEPAAVVVNNLGINYNNSGGTVLAPGVNLTNTSTRVSGIFTAPYSGEVVITAKASGTAHLYVNDKKVLSGTEQDRAATPEYALNVEKGKQYRIMFEQIQVARKVEIELNVSKKQVAEFSALVKRVKDADVIIYVGGLSPQLEGEEMPVSAEGFKGGDKVSIDLPKVQRQILADLKKAGKPVVFVLNTGSALALEQDEKNYDALLIAWYGGQAAGTAVADVLFGDYNPAGRLPITFYKTLEQLDKGLTQTGDPKRQGFENYDMQGRTYRYLKEEPLYSFGHGLSYSTFTYGTAKISSGEINVNEIPDKVSKIRISEGASITIPVTNTSNRGGDEVVQVYVKRENDPHAPIKSLRAFRRVYIEAGETKEIELKIDPMSFELYDEAANGLIPKPGNYTIFYGGSSANSKLNTMNIQAEL